MATAVVSEDDLGLGAVILSDVSMLQDVSTTIALK